jgi:hypothetical protein
LHTLMSSSSNSAFCRLMRSSTFSLISCKRQTASCRSGALSAAAINMQSVQAVEAEPGRTATGLKALSWQ